MLSRVRDFFDRHLAGAPSTPDNGSHSIELATAALLVEAMRIDDEATPAERAAVEHAIRAKFSLTDQETDELIGLAEEEVRQATDYFQFTSMINQRFTQAQKERVIELMWRVAYADAVIDAHERHLLRKIAALLHVSDSAYLAAKLRARDSAGSDRPHAGPEKD
ncbi:MAG: TerB family tellurite resistance protein [Betaproteobacteria bacterium]|nr:TerB family tellurite resistance protein [Betaproteobacteria bacterium]